MLDTQNIHAPVPGENAYLAQGSIGCEVSVDGCFHRIVRRIYDEE
jgi:hypothetical protein